MANDKRYRKKKKYIVIVKTDSIKFCKWNCDNLLSLCSFLDRSWPGWRWFNVFDKKSGHQLASFTNKSRPLTPFLM